MEAHRVPRLPTLDRMDKTMLNPDAKPQNARDPNRQTSPRLSRVTAAEETLFHEPVQVERQILDNVAPEWLITTTALIFCYKCDEFHHHDFQSRRQVSNTRGVPLYAELLYACRRCKEARVWGTEAPEETGTP